MEYREAVDMVEKMRARYDAGFSSIDKTEIEELYFEVLRKEFVPTSCSDCYRDAFIEIYNYLKTEKKMKEKCSYRLLNGVIIQDFENSKCYTNSNLTDEVAEEYLKRFPAQIKMFAEYPDDWEKKVKKDEEPEKEEGTVEDDSENEKKDDEETDKADDGEKMKKELVEELVDRMKDGVTVKQLQEDYKDYVVSGIKITDEELDECLTEAEDLVDIEKSESKKK